MKQKEIETLAATLLLKTQTKLQFPIKLESILAYLKIEIQYDDLCGEGGFILHQKGHFRILLDDGSYHSPVYRRFTIAHEIAHVVLGHLTHRKFLSHKQKEQEANQLAAAILMPFHFMVAYRNYESYILAKFMWVSEKAIEIRRETILKDPLYYKAVQREMYKENLLKDFSSEIEVM